MLKQKTIDLLKGYGIDADALTEAIKSDAEIDISLPELYTADKVSEIRTKAKKEGNDNSIKAGKEILIKDLKEQLSLEFEGKTPEAFLEAYKGHILNEAKLKPNEQVEKQATLLKEREKALTEAQQTITQLQNEKKATEHKATMLSALPDNVSDVLSKEQYLTLLNGMLEAKTEGDVTEYWYNGKRLETNEFAPLPLKEAVAHVFSQQKGWLKETTPETPLNGNHKKPAFGDNFNMNGGKFNNITELQAFAAKNNIEEGSATWSTLLNKAITDNANFKTEFA